MMLTGMRVRPQPLLAATLSVASMLDGAAVLSQWTRTTQPLPPPAGSSSSSVPTAQPPPPPRRRRYLKLRSPGTCLASSALGPARLLLAAHCQPQPPLNFAPRRLSHLPHLPPRLQTPSFALRGPQLLQRAAQPCPARQLSIALR